MSLSIRILGLDPGLSAMGWGVIEVSGSRLSHVAHGVIATKPAAGLAYRLIRDAFLAEEIVQEAFLAVWRDPEGYRENRGTFRSWLMSTVHHRAVDTVRREEAQRRRGRRAPEPAETTDPADSVAHEVDLIRERERVRAALEDLPPDQRRVLEMMYFEGKTQSNVAEELGDMYETTPGLQGWLRSAARDRRGRSRTIKRVNPRRRA